MKQTFLFSFLFIVLIASASAIYSGETQTLDLSGDFDKITLWNITGNSSPVGTYLWNDNMFNITIPEDYSPEIISLHFEGYQNGEERVITINSGSGSSGGSTVYFAPGTTRTINNNTIVYVNQTQPTNQNGTIVLTPPAKENYFKINFWFWIMIGTAVFLVVAIIALIVNSKRGESYY